LFNKTLYCTFFIKLRGTIFHFNQNNHPMKRIVIFLVTSAISISLLNACGPSEEEIRQRQQARQDSLEQVRQARLEQQRQTRLQQQRQDSITAAKERQRRMAERNRIEFDPSGAYAVQVGAWRSLDKAEMLVKTWQERGYENAFVIKFGKEETGNIWFRVRLGRVATLQMAEKLQAKLQRNTNTNSWISMADEGEPQNV
jgi:septal ring-binding cell division protein DamX